MVIYRRFNFQQSNRIKSKSNAVQILTLDSGMRSSSFEKCNGLPRIDQVFSRSMLNLPKNRVKIWNAKDLWRAKQSMKRADK
jgi:hypothetical protein